jgi:hypothetical protein
MIKGITGKRVDGIWVVSVQGHERIDSWEGGTLLSVLECVAFDLRQDSMGLAREFAPDLHDLTDRQRDIGKASVDPLLWTRCREDSLERVQAHAAACLARVQEHGSLAAHLRRIVMLVEALLWDARKGGRGA